MAIASSKQTEATGATPGAACAARPSASGLQLFQQQPVMRMSDIQVTRHNTSPLLVEVDIGSLEDTY